MTRIVFATDMHGRHYDQLTTYAGDTHPDAIVLGGDNFLSAPADSPTLLYGQAESIRLVAAKLARIAIPVFLIPGNHDYRANKDLYEREKAWAVLSFTPHRVGQYELYGYPYTPLSPFLEKDWEKYDMHDPSSLPRKLQEAHYALWPERRREGLISVKNPDGGKGWRSFTYGRKEAEESIEQDLAGLRLKAPRRSIVVTHAPPYGVLDVRHSWRTAEEEHRGSFAIRQFIEREQPLLTLHGHIHETVDRTGRYREQLGETVCATPGSYVYRRNQLALLDITLETLLIERVIV